MIHFLLFLAGMIALWLYDLFVAIVGTPRVPDPWQPATKSDPEDVPIVPLPSPSDSNTFTYATYQGETIVTKGENGATVTWTWTPKQ